jgi:hypothetical protein
VAFGKEAFGKDAYGKEAFGKEAFGKEAFGREAFEREAFGRDGVWEGGDGCKEDRYLILKEFVLFLSGYAGPRTLLLQKTENC